MIFPFFWGKISRLLLFSKRAEVYEIRPEASFLISDIDTQIFQVDVQLYSDN